MTSVTISDEQRADFERDGVICLRGMIEPALLSVLAEGIDSCLEHPGPKGRNFNSKDTPGRFAGDVFIWTFDDAMRQFLLSSPLAEIAAKFMGSNTAAHKSGALYQATGFDPNITYETDDYDVLPDIEADRSSYDIVAYETQPGDIVINHLRTLHAAPGNDTTLRRRAVAYRFTGDDAHYAVRKKGSTPIVDPGLKQGDPIPCDIFPQLWPVPSADPTLRITR